MDTMDIASLRDFFDLVREVWEHGVFGIQISETLLALLILAVLLLFRNLLTHFVLAACKRAAARTATRIGEQMLAALEPPIRFLPVVMGILFATCAARERVGLTPRGPMRAIGPPWVGPCRPSQRTRVKLASLRAPPADAHDRRHGAAARGKELGRTPVRVFGTEVPQSPTRSAGTECFDFWPEWV